MAIAGCSPNMRLLLLLHCEECVGVAIAVWRSVTYISLPVCVCVCVCVCLSCSLSQLVCAVQCVHALPHSLTRTHAMSNVPHTYHLSCHIISDHINLSSTIIIPYATFHIKMLKLIKCSCIYNIYTYTRLGGPDQLSSGSCGRMEGHAEG